MDNNNVRYCPQCGAPQPYDSVFCGNCGFMFNEQNGVPDYDPNLAQPPQYAGNYNPPPYNTPPYGQGGSGEGGKTALIVISIVLGAILVCVGIFCLFKYAMPPRNDNDRGVFAVATSQPATPTPSTPSPVATVPPPANLGSEYIIPDSSVREISTAELISLTNDQLMIARNEIYARHGRQFQTQWLQDYFNTCSWYTVNPYYNYNNEDSMLNSIEKKNAVTILNYENSRK